MLKLFLFKLVPNNLINLRALNEIEFFATTFMLINENLMEQMKKSR